MMMRWRALLVGSVMTAIVAVAIWRAPKSAPQGERVEGAAASAAGSGAAGAAAASAYVGAASTIMATRIELLVPRADAGWAPAEVFRIFRDVDARMSEWKPSSPLSTVNHAAGKRPVVVPADLRALLRRAIAFGRASDGAFDVTWAALWGLWRFTGDKSRLRVPAAADIEARRALVDYRRVRIDDTRGTVYLPERGMKLGLGAIAKGFALQRAAAALRARGLRSFLLSAGGQTYAAGKRGERPWRVGVRDPRGAPTDLIARLPLTDASAATSGDYERFFVRDGTRYHHILDPRTGRPARGLRSVTVIDADPVRADAMSTAIFVLGRQRGLALARRTPGLQALLVDDHGRIHRTAGLQR